MIKRGNGVKGGSRRDEKSPSVGQKADHMPGCYMLNRDGSNEAYFHASLMTHLEKKWGIEGRCVRDGNITQVVRPTIASVQQEFPELTAVETRKLLVQLCGDYPKKVEERRKNYSLMIGELLSLLHEDFKSRCRTVQAFNDAVAACNPPQLLTVIYRIAMGHFDGIPEIQLRLDAQTKLQTICMEPWMDLHSYQEEFNRRVSKLRNIDAASVPNDAMQVQIFFRGLRHGYTQFRNQFQNKLVDHTANMPVTINELIRLAGLYIPTSSNPTGTTMIYAAEREEKLSDVMHKIICRKCKKQGHFADLCPFTNDDKGETKSPADAKVVAESKVQEEKASSETSNEKKSKRHRKKKSKSLNPSSYIAETDYSTTLFDQYAATFQVTISKSVLNTDMIGPRMVVIDSAASHPFGHCRDLFSNVQRDIKVAVNGVSGRRDGYALTYMPLFGDAVITPHAKINGLPLKCLEKVGTVKYFQGDKIVCYIKSHDAHDCIEINLVFKHDPISGMYVASFEDNILESLKQIENIRSSSAVYSIETVMENEKRYSKVEVERAKQARIMKQRLAFPPDNVQIRIVNNGSLGDTGISSQDILRAKAIYGADEAEIQGRTTYKGPVKSTTILVPKSMEKNQTAHCDVFTWCKEAFVLFTLKPLKMDFVFWIPKSDNKEIWRNRVHILKAKVESRGYELEKITSDRDPVLNILAQIEVVPWERCASGDHNEHAEREIRLIKERLRCVHASLPYTVPKSFIKWLLSFVVHAINCTRRNDDECSPREAFTGEKALYKRDFKLSFGEYVHAEVHDSESNTNAPRTVPAIALCGCWNNKGSYFMYDIVTKKVFTCSRWHRLPIPETVIEILNQIAVQQKTDHSDVIVQVETRDTPAEDVETTRVVQPTIRDEVPLIDRPQDADEYSQEDVIERPENVPSTDEALTEVGHYITDDGVRKSHRIANRYTSFDMNKMSVARDEVNFNKMSMKEGLKLFGQAALEGIIKEIDHLMKLKTWETIQWNSLTHIQRKKALSSFMFLKLKTIDDLRAVVKARLVAGGHQQDKQLYDDVSSPTAANESVMIVIAMAAAEGRHLATIDVTAAFVEAMLPMDQVIYMILDKKVSDVVVQLHPEYDSYRNADGKLIVKLIRALYGCLQSAKLWYILLAKKLIRLGYHCNPYDNCVYNKILDDGTHITLVFHVDDILVTYKSEHGLSELEESMRSDFCNITVTRGDVHKFLSMKIIKLCDGITVNMSDYIEKCLSTITDLHAVSTPSRDDLFYVDEDSPLLSDEEKQFFHSGVARLLYLAKRTRLDILTIVSHLSSRVTNPTQDDHAKLRRLYGYLQRTKSLSLKFRLGDLNFVSYIDASFGVHVDGTSRTGVVMMMCGAPIGGWSAKQKIVTTSSTEAELVALSEGVMYVIWVRHWLESFGHCLEPTTVYQDNMSVLQLLSGPRHQRQRTKHLHVRYFFVRDRVDMKQLNLCYMPTRQMLADVMTKPVTGALFQELTAKLFAS